MTVCTTNHYDKGDRIRLTATFRDVAGTLTDPTTVTAKVRNPAGTITSYSGGQISHPSTGIYRLDIDVDVSGVWTYRFNGAGALVAAEEALLAVDPSSF